MALFNSDSIRDLDEIICITADIKILHALCITNKYLNNLCNNDYFWTRKYEHDNLPKPLCKLSSINNHIITYTNTYKKMQYVNHVLKTEDIRINFTDLKLFHPYVDQDTLEKVYMALRKLNDVYLSYMQIENDDYNYARMMILYIRHENTGKYNILLRIGDQFIIESKKILIKDDVIHILYELISTYNIPYDNGPIKVIQYNF